MVGEIFSAGGNRRVGKVRGTGVNIGIAAVWGGHVTRNPRLRDGIDIRNIANKAGVA